MKRFRLLVALLLSLVLVSPTRADSVYLPLVEARFFDRPVTWATVTKVWDGDTFDVDLDGDGVTDDRVRPIGMDAPEISFGIECYGLEAKARAVALLDGQRVALERDVSERDSYDRLLRYVYLTDGTWFNGLMVREGYALAGCWPPDCKYTPALCEIQAEARAAGVGGWAECEWEEAGKWERCEGR